MLGVVYSLREGGTKESFFKLSKMTTCEDDHVAFQVKDSDVKFCFSEKTRDVSRFLTCCKEKREFERISVKDQVKPLKSKVLSPSKGKRKGHTRGGVNSRHAAYVH